MYKASFLNGVRRRGGKGGEEAPSEVRVGGFILGDNLK